MTKKRTTNNSHHSKFLENVGKYSKLGPGTRSLFQKIQGDFDPNSSEDYLLFFQLVYSTKGNLLKEECDFSKYASPKFLSIKKRSDSFFKLTKLDKCLSLRYTCAQCSNCNEFYSTFNTTKHYKSWETDSMPTISKKLLKFNGNILCTDCVFLMHIEDDENE
jgi:hypothetical protein